MLDGGGHTKSPIPAARRALRALPQLCPQSGEPRTPPVSHHGPWHTLAPRTQQASTGSCPIPKQPEGSKCLRGKAGRAEDGSARCSDGRSPPAKKGWKPRGCPDRRLRRWAPQPSSALRDGAVPVKVGGRAGGARGVPDQQPRCPRVGTRRVKLLPGPPVLKTGITSKAGTAFCCAEPPRQTPAAQSHPPQQAAPRQAGGRQGQGDAMSADGWKET